MRILTAIDLETTGLPRGMELNDPNYPRMIQIGGVTWTSDDVSHGRIQNYVMQRDKRTSRGAEKIHGISDHLSNSRGIKEAVALSWILSTVNISDDLVGWSLNFDLGIIKAALIRHERDPDQVLRPGIRTHDLQEIMMPMVNKTFDDGSLCLPSMNDGYQHLFGKPLYEEGQKHDALRDAEACREIFMKLWEMDLLDIERKAA